MVPWMLWMGALTIVGKSCVAMAIVWEGGGKRGGRAPKL